MESAHEAMRLRSKAGNTSRGMSPEAEYGRYAPCDIRAVTASRHLSPRARSRAAADHTCNEFITAMSRSSSTPSTRLDGAEVRDPMCPTVRRSREPRMSVPSRAMRVRLTGLGHAARQDVVAFRKKNQHARMANAMDRAE